MSRMQHNTKAGQRGVATVYLIHFNRRLKHAGHYIGFTTDLDKRLTDHLCGQGARLMEVLMLSKIEWKLARTWRGDRKFERWLKNKKDADWFCPICSGEAAMNRAIFPKGGRDQ